MSQTNPNDVEQKNYQEELTVIGEQLVSKVKELLHEGNVRRLIIKQEGRTLLEVPLTVGVVGVLMAPTLAALGAVGALIAQCSIEVVRTEPTTPFKNDVPTYENPSYTDLPPTQNPL